MQSLTHYSTYIDPSRIRTLIVPIGKWRESSFTKAISRIKDFNEIRLLDITPIDSPLFTPQGFPNGRLLFDINIIAKLDESDMFLYDFEPFRKTFIVIGLVNDDSDPIENLEILKDKYPTVISHNLIYSSKDLDNTKTSDANVFYRRINEEISLETVMCDIGKNFLQALNHYYSSYKHVTLRSPGAIGGSSVLKTKLTRQVTTANSMMASKSSATSNPKRLSSFEATTNTLKRSASMKLATTLSTSENKAQQRSRGRQLKILGNFQLLSGRYIDAMASFTESIILLHKTRDYIWLGSGLDGLAICFILLSYLQLPFQIPEIIDIICPVPLIDPSSIENNNNLNSTSSPRNSVVINGLQSPRGSMAFNQRPALNIDVEKVNLPLLIKTLSEKTLYYYDLSLSHNTEYAPQIVYSTCLLKTLTFMTSCHNGTILSADILNDIIKGRHNHENNSQLKEDFNPLFNKIEVYAFANRLFELQLKDMELESQVEIYSTLAAVYKILGFLRKESFVLRLLMVTLLISSETLSWHQDYRALICNILNLYGIEIDQPESAPSGWLFLQKKAIQLCLAISEIISDKAYISKLSILLLRKYSKILTTAEEERMLQNYINPMVTSGVIKTYWDEYILRGVKIQSLEFDNSGAENSRIPLASALINESRKAKEISKINTQEVFNPFKQLQITAKARNNSNPKTETPPELFLIGDKAEFSIELQNPFKFDVPVSNIELNPKTAKYCTLIGDNFTNDNPYVIKPLSIQTISLILQVKKETFHDVHLIDSLNMSIFNLPPQEFKIVSYKDNSEVNAEEKCTYDQVKLQILPEQPELQLLNTSKMTGNVWMMLDGTSTNFTVTLRNKSLTCNIDYLQFTPVTSIEQSLKPDYWKKLRPDELYSLEKKLEWLKKNCITTKNAPRTMKPNEVIEFNLNVNVSNAPLELTGFDLLIEYGMKAADQSCVYLKKLRLPYKLTIKSSIEVPTMDIIPVNELLSDEMERLDWIDHLMKQIGDNENRKNDYALLLFDVRNSWIDGMSLEVQFEEFKSNSYLIEGSHTSRIIVPIKKIDYRENHFATTPIPSISKGRQFIQSGLTEQEEIGMRESFWFKEYLLSRLKGSWKLSTDKSITGTVDFGKFIEKIDAKMVSVACKGKSSFDIKMTMEKTNVKIGDSTEIVVEIQTNTKDRLNKTPPTEYLHYLIFDHFSSQALPKSNGKLLYNGSLSKPINSCKDTRSTLELIPLNRGKYEIHTCISDAACPESILHYNANFIVFTVY
ncbi:TRAPPII-specific subunit TRS120 NDAI_0A04190 [Naumovozyma dairenensis CBS 421]|uniref:Uncharacterized protein n=1 Tax=Naumovozyma dairenensis (strain ATCC 10597 / BCRC 20456 / CBS 421 / NBRC 0211 / NRRL Y-12639) TaxID=1071378 RepID=G0W438_NAUDC|nr:hypothetical protein NDAI_0A04190 [Naumovozyma dairenensis CBS 421]CCD22576.1 hypothetical protein NDAI_0A04190 [Naumovozyma dairenensis CBS 421]